MDTTATWKPLLDGEDATQAWDAIGAVAADLHPDRTPFVPLRGNTRTPAGRGGVHTAGQGSDSACECGVELGAGEDEPGLAEGTAGLALFFAYLAAATGDEAHAESALAYLDRAIEQLAEQPVDGSLFCGFTGIGWTLEHLATAVPGPDRLVDPAEAVAANRDVDAQLVEMLRRRPWTGDYDLIGGLTGLAVYALEGAPRPASRVCVELLVAQLAATACERPGGVSWFTPPQRLPRYQRETAREGYYNLGVAHGVPGVLAVLGRICEAHPEQDRARELAGAAAAWLLEQEMETSGDGDAGDGSCFASWVAKGAGNAASNGDRRDPPARLAWCYGDAGLAAALLAAARSLGRDDWEQAALRVARRAAGRTVESSRVADAGLCHGAGGLGHIFNRLYQASGEDALGGAARAWFRRALQMRRDGEGIGGFLTWYPDQQRGEMVWTRRRGFLTGAAGVALALLGAVSPIEPCWDRLLLTHVAPEARQRNHVAPEARQRNHVAPEARQRNDTAPLNRSQAA